MQIGFEGLTAIGFGLSDYQKMFNLEDEQLNMHILDCRGGASAFAAQMHKMGKQVIATDPIYAHDFQTLEALIDKSQADIKQTLANQQTQEKLKTPQIDAFLNEHKTYAKDFLEDFKVGKQAGRYVAQSLPQLSFKQEAFDLALVCHFLFTYPELDVAFHLQAIEELLRVANEVRIFPLVTQSGELSPIVGDVIAAAQIQNFGAELKEVDYHLQAKGNAMLRLWNPSCSVEAHQPQD